MPSFSSLAVLFHKLFNSHLLRRVCRYQDVVRDEVHNYDTEVDEGEVNNVARKNKVSSGLLVSTCILLDAGQSVPT